MADVSIDSSVSTSTARGLRSIVFVTKDIGYFFYIDSGTAGLKYSKTTDGGATWGAGVLVSPAVAVIAFDVWFDKWTPGDTGTLIHFWHFEASADDVVYRSLDTSNDTLGTARVVFAGATAVAGRGTFVSGTKTRSGYLYCAFDIDAGAEKGLHRSTDDGVTWSSNLSTTFVEATLDICLLFPASNTGDNNDCWALYHDADVNALTVKVWDSSAAAQLESVTIQTHVEGATDLTGQIGFSGTICHRTGVLLIAAVSEFDTATSTHQVFEFYSTTEAILTHTAITLNIDDHYYPQIFCDQRNDDIYVAYNGKRDGSETLGTTSKVYYTKSINKGASWSAGDTIYMEGAAGAVTQIWAPLMGPRFYVGWRNGTTLVGNCISSVYFPSFDELRQSILDGMVADSTESQGWNSVLSNIPVSAVIRTSDRQITVTLPPLPAYDVMSDENVTVTLPGTTLWRGEIIEVPVPVPIGVISSGIVPTGSTTMGVSNGQ